MVGVAHCIKRPKYVTCNSKFDRCAYDCAKICEKTINRTYEFGKCFSICAEPCRKDYCKEARMVEMGDTEDLKSFADAGVGVQVPL